MIQQSKVRPFVFCGRRFLPTEIELMRALTSDFRALSLTEIARTICELLEWKRPNGRLKNHECRLLLEKLSVAGLVNLPPLRERGPRGPRVVRLTGEWRSASVAQPESGPTYSANSHSCSQWSRERFMERVSSSLPLSRIQSSRRG